MSQHAENSNVTYNTDFSDYYDRMNQHKDYAAEVSRLDRFIREQVTSPKPKVLDIGCGTGQHSVLLSTKGYDITAIDLSPDMIRIAKDKKTDVHFTAGDIAELEATGFEFAYCLFNVVNCLNSPGELTQFFKAIANRLNDGAMLLTEAWNAIAVIAEPPTVVERVYEGRDDRIVRKVTPSADFFHQRLDLRYDVDILDNASGKKLRGFDVVHNLVLFTPLEIEFCLQQAGFDEVKAYTALPHLAEVTAQDRMLAFTARKWK